MKKVLLIVIDALASRVIRPAMDAGKLPNLQALAEVGSVDWNCTAIFPSITPAATAALITSGYPCESGISGAYFYDHEDDHIHYYGDDTWAILRRGFSDFFEDFLVHLNRDQLRIDTAFQTVEQAGHEAACLNYLWFHGESEHEVRVPWLLRMWPGVFWTKSIPGPRYLSLGDFVSSRLKPEGPRIKGPGGLFRRLGFADAATGHELLLMARENAFPQFTVAYFPDNDFNSHSDGPETSLATVQKIDAVLGQFFEACGGLQKLLETMAVVITGDHAQSDLPQDKEDTGILLDQVLDTFEVVPAGENWSDGDELMICPNMRAAQIYLRSGYWDQRQTIVDRLLQDPRIDQVMWREADARFCVETRAAGRLTFGTDQHGGASAQDEYGTRWRWEGNLEAVDASVQEDGLFKYGDYPNALERIATAFDEEVSGDLWVTAKLGFEFRLEATSVHRSGSHGSLHAHDSLSPLFTAGVPENLLPQQTPRSVDVAPLCLSVFGLTGNRTVGESHVSAATQSTG